MFSSHDQLEEYLDLALLLGASNHCLSESENVSGKSDLSFNDLLDIAREYEQTRQPECETTPAPITSESQCAVNAMVSVNSHIGTNHEGPVRSSPRDPGPYRSRALEFTESSIDQHSSENHLAMSPAVYQPDTTLDQSARRHPWNKENQTCAAPRLLGWSPPDGSEGLDVEPPEMHYPPWLAKLLNPIVPEWLSSSSRSCPMQSENDTPRLLAGRRKLIPNRTELTRGKAIPPPPPQLPPTRTVLGSVQTQTSRKPTCRPYSTTTTTAGYASAPRGGVPPQLARDVTKANILRVEQERENIRKAAASSNMDLKKPSVLRGLERPAKARGETADLVESKGSVGRKRAWDEEAEPAHAMKRTRL